MVVALFKTPVEQQPQQETTQQMPQQPQHKTRRKIQYKPQRKTSPQKTSQQKTSQQRSQQQDQQLKQLAEQQLDHWRNMIGLPVKDPHCGAAALLLPYNRKQAADAMLTFRCNIITITH